MHNLRKVAAAAALTSVAVIPVYFLSRLSPWTLHQSVFVIAGCAAIFVAIAALFTQLTIDALTSTKTELMQGVAHETKALQLSIMAEIEEYGNARAIDAVIASERRRVVNERNEPKTIDLALNSAQKAKVTPIRRRQ